MRTRKYTQKIKLHPSSLRSYGLMDQTGREIENDTEIWEGGSSIRIRKTAKGLEWKDLCPGCNLYESVLTTPIKIPWCLLDSPSKKSQTTYNGPPNPSWPGSAPRPHHLAPSTMLSCLQPLWSLCWNSTHQATYACHLDLSHSKIDGLFHKCLKTAREVQWAQEFFKSFVCKLYQEQNLKHTSKY